MKKILLLIILIFLNLISFLIKSFFKEESFSCNFCKIIGVLSISNNKYEPPCKSNPKLIFLLIKLLSLDKKLDNVKKLIQIMNIYIDKTLNFEKYNTY